MDFRRSLASRLTVDSLRLALLLLTVSIARWLLTDGRDVPELSQDEFAQLAIARRLSGGSWTMADFDIWQPGLGLMTAPLQRLVDDPRSFYASVLIVNCILGGLGAVVLALLIRRTIILEVASPTWSVIVAGVVALSPANIRSSALAWAEPAVFLAFATVLLCFVSYQQDRRLRWLLSAVAAASLGYLFHARMLPITLMATVIACALAVREGRRAAGLCAIAGIGGLTAVIGVSRWVVDRVWEQPSSTNTVSETLRRLNEPGSVLVSAIGQGWYLLASSLGIAGLGTLVLVGAIRGRNWASRMVRPTDATIILVLTGTAFATSTLFMAGRSFRADQIIYGRYNDAVFGVVIALGLAALSDWSGSLTRRRLTVLAAIAGTTLGAAVIVEHYRGVELRTGFFARIMVSGIAPFVYGSPRDLIRVSVISMVLGAVVTLAMWATRARSAAMTLFAVILTIAGALRIADINSRSTATFGPLAVVREITEVVPAGASIGVVLDSASDPLAARAVRAEFSAFQFFLPEYELRPVGPEPIREGLVFAADADSLPTASLTWESDVTILSLWTVD